MKIFMKQSFLMVLRAVVVSAAVVFSFAACQGNEPDNSGNGNGTENGPGNGEDNGGNGGGGEEQPQFTMTPVDLGLSVKWADSNLGTTIATESGEYYAGGSDPVPGLCGKDWRTPTKEEFEELINPSNCSVEETTEGEVKGYKITSLKNGKSIFLPAAGYKKGGNLKEAQEYGCYWSSTACGDEPAALYLDFMMQRGHQGEGTEVRVNNSINNKSEGNIFSESDLTYYVDNIIITGNTNNRFTYYPDGSFKLSWDKASSDFFVTARVGQKYNSDKTPDEIGCFAADYKFTKDGGGSSFSFLGINGWFTDSSSELVGFYIVEDWAWNSRPNITYYNDATVQKMGEYDVDGDSYELFFTYRFPYSPYVELMSSGKNRKQYFAIRKNGRQKGHVDISAHFREWKEKYSISVGKLERVMVSAEVLYGGGYSGSVDFTYVNIYPQADYVSWLADNELSGADAAWNATPAKWGGKVTNAYMYNKGKDNPIRFPAGFDPYLNLREQSLLQSIRPVTK